MSLSSKAVVKNEKGIHARPSSEIAKEALKYNSEITIQYDSRSANAKDVLQLIMLELFKGSEVVVMTSGDDEKEALEKITQLIEKEFDFD